MIVVSNLDLFTWKCNYCNYTSSFNFFTLLKLFLKGSTKYKCPRCGHYHCFKMIYHIVKDNTVVFSENKVLDDNKKELFRNG